MYKRTILTMSFSISYFLFTFNYCFFHLLETLVEKMMFLSRAESAFPALDWFSLNLTERIKL